MFRSRTPSAPFGPVATAAAVVHDGETVRTFTSGARDPGGAPVTVDTAFQVASLSKPVTALTVLRLVQNGTLALDDDVNRYLRGGEVVTPTGRPVVIRQLLAHTAGLGILRRGRDLLTPWVEIGERRDRARPSRDLYGSRLRTLADPETAWSYGSHGYGVIERVVEDVTGRAFADVVQAEVFEPLDLRHSVYAPLPPSDRPVAHGCRRTNTIRWYRPRVFSPVAGGGLWTSAADLARLAAAVLEPSDGTWLAPALRAELLRPQPFAGGVHPYMGLGLRLGSRSDRAAAFHGGRWWGTFSHLLLVPDRAAAVVVLATGCPPGALMDRLLDEMVSRTPGEARPGRARPITGGGPDRSLTGSYRTKAPLLGALTAHLGFGGEVRVVARSAELRMFSAWGVLRHGVALRPLGNGRYSFLVPGQRSEVSFVRSSRGITLFLAAPMCCFTRVDAAPRRAWCVRALGRVLNATADLVERWRWRRWLRT